MTENKKSLQSCNGLDTILSDDLTLLRQKEMKSTSPVYLSPPLPSINQMEADKNQREKLLKEQVIFQLQKKSNLHSRYGSLQQDVLLKDSALNKLDTIKDYADIPSPSHNVIQAINSNLGEEDQTFTENSVRKLIKHQATSSSTSTYLKKGKQPMSFQLFIKLMKAQRQFKSFLTPRQIPLKALKFIKDIASNENAGTSSILFSSQKSKLFSTFSNQSNKLGELNRAIRLHTNRLKEYLLGVFDRNVPVMNPLSQFRICFDVVLILTVVFALFFNTIEVFFDLQFNELYSDFYPIIKWIWIFVFLLNIFLNLNTGIYQKGTITLSHEAVWTYYFNNRFLSDILSIFSLITFPSHYSPIFVIFKLFILFKIPLVVSKLNFAMQTTQTVQSSSQIYNLIRLIKLILTILCVAHFMAIAFYGQVLIGEKLETDQQNWVQACKVLDMSDPWAKKYIFALYFSVTTMVTVGYGDITPEAVLVIISMVISSGIFAYTFNLIGSIISDMNKKQKIYKKKLHMMNIYLLNHNVDPDLCYQVQNFLEYKFQSDQQLSKEEEENVLSDLSPNLQESVNFEVKKNIFSKGQNIFSTFSVKMRNLLCLEMKEVRANKGEIIFEQGDIEEDPKIYFIHRGSVDITFPREIHINSEEIILSSLQEGMYFGEVSFLIDQPRLSSAKVRESSIIYSLSRSDFLRVIATDKADQEKFFMISSKITFNKSLSVINGQCFYCQKESHTVNTCPFLHYSPALDLVILKEKYSVPTLERQYQVRLSKKFNSLLSFSVNKEIAMKIRKKIKNKNRKITQPSEQVNKLNEEELSISRKTTDHKSMTNSLNLQTIYKIEEHNSSQGEGEEDEDGLEQLFSDHSSYSLTQSNEESEISIPSLNQSDKRINSFCADNKNHGMREKSVESIPEESCINIKEQHKVKPNQFQSNTKTNDPLLLLKLSTNLKVKKEDNVQHSKLEATENEREQQENLFDKDQGELPEKGEIPPSFSSHKNNLFSELKILLTTDPESAISNHTILPNKQHTPKHQQGCYGDTLTATKTNSVLKAQSRQRIPSTSFQFPEDTPQRIKSVSKSKGLQFAKQHQTGQSSTQTQQSQQQFHQSSHFIKSYNNLKDNISSKRIMQTSNTPFSMGSKNKEVIRLNEKLFQHKSEGVIHTIPSEDILSRFDEMHEFEFYYPHYNFKNMISNYNRLRNFQNIKLPPYFGVYSFVNRKDRKLKYRLQTLGIKRIRQYEEQQPIEKQTAKKKNS